MHAAAGRSQHAPQRGQRLLLHQLGPAGVQLRHQLWAGGRRRTERWRRGDREGEKEEESKEETKKMGDRGEEETEEETEQILCVYVCSVCVCVCLTSHLS